MLKKKQLVSLNHWNNLCSKIVLIFKNFFHFKVFTFNAIAKAIFQKIWAFLDSIKYLSLDSWNTTALDGIPDCFLDILGRLKIGFHRAVGPAFAAFCKLFSIEETWLASDFLIGSALGDVHLSFLNWLLFLILMGGLQDILNSCLVSLWLFIPCRGWTGLYGVIIITKEVPFWSTSLVSESAVSVFCLI